MFIPDETIQEIRERTDIVEIISRYVDLRRAGSNLKALCPFHQEKTPSFMVSPEKQIFHCFGCGNGGNVFVFLMEMEGVSFPEAVETLGNACGVEVPKKRAVEKSKNEALYAANEFAARFYHKLLKRDSSGEKARRYLMERGIIGDAWDKFRIGFAPDAWDRLFKEVRKSGMPIDGFKELKLIVPGSKGGYYDYFRNRILFPIITVSGRIIAFGGRVLAEGDEPKYLNSIESPLFSKRRTFFGLYNAREAIRKVREAVLVEGYTDCISLHQAGIENCIASCGTAVTAEHASALRRFCSRVLLIPDGDAAGETAAVTTGAITITAGMGAKVAKLDSGTDPDSVARAIGKDGIDLIIEKAMDYFEFLNYIIKNRVTSLQDKEALLLKLVEGVSSADDKVRIEMFLRELSTVFSIDMDVLRERARRATRHRGHPESERTEASGQNSTRLKLEKMVLRLMMEGSPSAEEALSRLDSDDFCQESCRQFYKVLDAALEKHIDLESREFQRLAEKAGISHLAAEIAFISIPPGDIVVLLKDYVKRMKELKIRDELKVLSEKLRMLPGESEEAIAVAEYYKRLRVALSQL